MKNTKTKRAARSRSINRNEISGVDQVLAYQLKVIAEMREIDKDLRKIPKYDNWEDVKGLALQALRAQMNLPYTDNEIRDKFDRAPASWREKLADREFELTSLAYGLVECSEIMEKLQDAESDEPREITN